MKTLALVPAKARSTGIRGKNCRQFRGHPLFVLAVKVGAETCTDVCVSTDSAVIQDVAYQYGAIVHLRPRGPETDNGPMFDVVRSVSGSGMLSFDVPVLLQPTQPLRKPEHVRAALKLLEETGADSVVSVVQIPERYSPEYAVEITAYNDLAPFDIRDGLCLTLDAMSTRRQDCRAAYSRDGTVYAIRRETIEKGSLYGERCVPLIIPASESVNLDTEEDWLEAERRIHAEAHS